jgi:hypothetical protein
MRVKDRVRVTDMVRVRVRDRVGVRNDRELDFRR